MSKIIKILKSLIRPTGIAAFSPSKKIREKEREREREKREKGGRDEKFKEENCD